MMSDCSHWPDQQIINQSQFKETPGPFAQFGQELSSVRVSIPEAKYQTRTTTYILVKRSNEVTFVEKNHVGDIGTVRHTFDILSP